MPVRRVAGAFEFKRDRHPNDETPDYYFNLGPKAGVAVIPEDQRNISHDAYEARNILMLLKNTIGLRHILQHTDPTFVRARRNTRRNTRGNNNRPPDLADEFIIRIKQAARAGCVGPNVHVSLAAQALQQIREDIMRRAAKPIIYRYLTVLGLYAVGVGLAAAVFAACAHADKLGSYGYVVIGAMLGAWLSAVATRQQVTFAGLQNFVDVIYDPPVRILFVTVLAVVLTLILQAKLITIDIKGFDISKIDSGPWAVVIGAAIGMSEQALSVKVIDRVRQVLKLR